MPISKQLAQASIENFKLEFPSAANLTFILLADENDFHDYFGSEHFERAIQQWGTSVGGFLPTQNIVAVASQHAVDADDVRRVLFHEVIGHSGSLTFSDTEKRALLSAIVDARREPSLIRWWAGIDQAYPHRTELEKAEEVFCLACETLGRVGYVERAFEHVWSQAILSRAEPLQAWGLVQVAEHVAAGYRAGARPQQIFPRTDFDLFNPEPGASVDSPTPVVPTLGGGAILKSAFSMSPNGAAVEQRPQVQVSLHRP